VSSLLLSFHQKGTQPMNSNLDSRLDKLEARMPAEQRPWVQMIFDPEDYGGNVDEMNAAIDKASQEVWDSGKHLIVQVLVPAVQGRPKYPEQLLPQEERPARRLRQATR
jgi:hypothetical protein